MGQPAEISTLGAVDRLMYIGTCATCQPRSFCPEGVALIKFVLELFYTNNAGS
jgi:primosomal replication protein N